MNIKVQKVRKDALVPIRASNGAIGYDVFASRVLDKETKMVLRPLPMILHPEKSVLIGIGIRASIPMSVRCEMVPRSGLVVKHNIILANSPGTVDPDYRGEVGAILFNNGFVPFTIEKDMRIAQLIFSKVKIPVLEEVTKLSDTARGAMGFGDTGLFGIGLGTSKYEEMIRRKDRYYMNIVLQAANLSICVRGVKRTNGKYERDAKGNFVNQTRKFGCIIVSPNDNIIAHGYNAQYPGSQKCEEVGCLREELKVPSGEQLGICRAMHAEWWAITNVGREGSSIGMKGSTVYINTEPCKVCAKIIAGLSVSTVVMIGGVYPINGVDILKDADINTRFMEGEI